MCPNALLSKKDVFTRWAESRYKELDVCRAFLFVDAIVLINRAYIQAIGDL